MGSCPSTQTHRGDVAAGGQMAMAAAVTGGDVGPANGTGRSMCGMFSVPATGSCRSPIGGVGGGGGLAGCGEAGVLVV
eukprot:8040328-Alexandrium_andersonii.AAC.1